STRQSQTNYWPSRDDAGVCLFAASHSSAGRQTYIHGAECGLKSSGRSKCERPPERFWAGEVAKLSGSVVSEHTTMQSTSNTNYVAIQKDSRPSHRPAENSCAALRLLERLRKAAREGKTPSTADLQSERVYVLRPVNRIGDLISSKHNATRYDIEPLDCEHGV